MPTKAEKIAWLKEHLAYERTMLEYTYQRMVQSLLAGQQMDFNAFLESFAIHARLLHDFLVSGAGSDNYGARDFVEGFKTRKPSAINGAKQRINRQVTHSAKKRIADATGKFTSKDCVTFYDWLTGAFDQFIAQLDDDYKKAWPGKPPVASVTIPVGHGPTATNVVTSSIITFPPKV